MRNVNGGARWMGRSGGVAERPGWLCPDVVVEPAGASEHAMVVCAASRCPSMGTGDRRRAQPDLKPDLKPEPSLAPRRPRRTRGLFEPSDAEGGLVADKWSHAVAGSCSALVRS
jgi:hypothetical protein